VGTEIERKFLLADAPGWLREHEAQRIEQGYLAIEEGEGAEVRLRRKGDGTVLTVKRGMGRTREEEEIDLSAAQFAALWPLTEGRRIAKTRYLVPRDALTLEVDVFEGGLAGMVTAEVEFESETASEDFEPPDWLGEEVTGDPRYANETLAVRGPPG
jgi:adenylate cyclase